MTLMFTFSKVFRIGIISIIDSNVVERLRILHTSKNTHLRFLKSYDYRELLHCKRWPAAPHPPSFRKAIHARREMHHVMS